ncbi:MAG: hypothetical protein LBF65_00965 [Holosporales bacterium]|jgi:hypothetical protein|nr:hypothetical protein [Holosporales bacterium]
MLKTLGVIVMIGAVGIQGARGGDFNPTLEGYVAELLNMSSDDYHDLIWRDRYSLPSKAKLEALQQDQTFDGLLTSSGGSKDTPVIA